MTFHELFLFVSRRVVAIVAPRDFAGSVRPDAPKARTRSFVTALISRKMVLKVVAVTTLIVVGHPLVAPAQSCWDKCHAVAMAVYDGDDDNLEAASRAFDECLAQFCQA